jgi:hypothetical protein
MLLPTHGQLFDGAALVRTGGHMTAGGAGGSGGGLAGSGRLDPIGTPVGPVAAGIMVVFIVLVIAVYAYRHQVGLRFFQ